MPAARSIGFDAASRTFCAVLGGGFLALQALIPMTYHDASPGDDALDALVVQLLDCGGALSQIIGRMQEYEASGLSAPDAPPILDVAHCLIRDVNGALLERHTDEEIRVSAAIVEQVTTAICENIFFVPPSEIRRASPGRSRAAGSRRRAPRSGRRRH